MRRAIFTVALALLVAPAVLVHLVAQNAPGAGSAGSLTADEQLIIDFFGFTGTREARAERFMTPDYVQHNPRFLRMDESTGAKGNQAWVAAFAEAQRRGGIQLVALAGIPLRNPIIVLQDGDLAHAIYRGTRPDPAALGQTYEVFAFESFRIRNGKFSEHWDQVRLAKGWMQPPPPAAPAAAGAAANAPARGRGPAEAPVVPLPTGGCSTSADRLAANKRLALTLVDGQPNPETVRARLASDFVEHSPRGLGAPRVPEPDAGSPRTVDHMLAECEFVSIVWKQTMRDPDAASRTWELFTFDAFRLRGDQVVEHWSHELR